MTEKSFFPILSIFALLLMPAISSAALRDIGGRIVLQVEENGEAWYVSPDGEERFYLGRPHDAFSLMREKGVGISDADLQKIPIGLDILSGADTDNDGLPDELEKSIGTDYNNPDTDKDKYNDLDELRSGNDPRSYLSLSFNPYFTTKHSGKIFIQVEAKGQAWYVFPGNNRRYYLGRPDDAFRIMKLLGLGISNEDLDEIMALTPNFSLSDFEKRVHELINVERVKYNLPELILNTEVSAVARRHSQDLANENKSFTAIDSFCSFPLIHHEGLQFGVYHGERLENSGVNYLKMSGENIALLGGAAVTLLYQAGSVSDADFEYCDKLQIDWDKNFKSKLDNETDEAIKINIVKDEIKKRSVQFRASRRLEIGTIEWENMDELAIQTVDGWMNSPGHRKNILQADYDEAGMGSAYVNSYVITTQVFISRTNCGYDGAPCCNQGDYNVCYEPKTCVRGFCQSSYSN